jgi:hypothetical protein
MLEGISLELQGEECGVTSRVSGDATISTAHWRQIFRASALRMAGHTDIFPKNLFWYHLLTALAYKTL